VPRFLFAVGVTVTSFPAELYLNDQIGMIPPRHADELYLAADHRLDDFGFS